MDDSQALYVLLGLATVALLVFGIGHFRTHSRLRDDTAPQDSKPTVETSLETELEDNISWLPDAVIVLNQDLTVVWANNTSAEWMGFTGAKAHGLNLPNQLYDTPIAKYLLDRDFRKALDCSAPNAPEIILRIRIVPFRNRQLLLQARDVSQIKNLEMVRRDFVANASHELRTPISILYGYLDMMMQEDTSIDAQWQPAIRQMHGQTERIKQIIEDMMILSRLEDGSLHDEHAFVEMAPLLESAHRNAQVLSNEKQHDIDLDIDMNYALNCNIKEIESLIANLVSNAVRYTPDNGKIIITWKVDLVGGTLSVKDNGIGIDAQDIPRLTERFYRTDPGRSKETGGTGLGLAIVNHIVTRHQAQLIVNSQPKKGSEFAVQFPMDRIKKDHDQVNLLLH